MKNSTVNIVYSKCSQKNTYAPFIKSTVIRAVNEILKMKYAGKILPGKRTVNILITDSGSIKALSKKYRNIDKSTNELSFSYVDDPENDIIGEIVINWDEIIKDSDPTFEDRKASLANVIVHALLHIFGMEHGKTYGMSDIDSAKDGILKRLEENRRRK
mgnify:CR=1 FL=1